MIRASHFCSRRHRSAAIRAAARRAAAALIEPVERRTLMSAGAMDPTFGTAGTVTHGGNAYANLAVAATDAQGRLVVAYNQTPVHGADAVVTRLDANGTTDATFGVDGTVAIGTGPDTTDYPDEGGVDVTQVIPLPDGDILLVGTTIQELTSTGALDTRFGGGGPGDVGVGSGYLYPAFDVASVAVQSDGKLLAEGDNGRGSIVVERYNANGSVDTTYGVNGQATITPPAPAGKPYGDVDAGPMTLDPAGSAIVSFYGGIRANAVGLGYATAIDGLARITTAGQIDTSYGNAGFAVTPVTSNLTVASEIAAAPDGTLYQATTSAAPGSNVDTPGLFVYSADGRSVAAGVVPGDGSVTDVAVGADGKPILSTSDGHVDRLLPIDPTASASAAIVFDTTFAASGSAAIAYPALPYDPVGSTTFGANTVGYDNQGRLIVTSSGGGEMAVSRLLMTGPSSVTPVPATGTVIGSPGSYLNEGNTAAKAFDGNPNTFYDAAHTSGDWTGLDLGTAAKPIVQIQYAPRANWAARMVGGQFQVSSTPDFSSDVQTIYTVTAVPAVGTMTTVAVGNVPADRYVRYIGPAGGSCNVAEIRFLVAGPTQLAGTPIGTPGSWSNQGNTFANALDGNLNTFYDAYAYTGDWVGLDLGAAQTVTQVRFAPRAGFAGRMVGGEIQASNTADFSSGVVTAYTITSPPPVGTLTTVTLPSVGAYRYWRYLGPAGGECNIAELEFDG